MKFAVPGTFVPGAIYLGSATGKKHKWQMPKPVSYVECVQVIEEVVLVDDKPRMTKVKKKVRFPVYRGMEANLARKMRADGRRHSRKMRELRELGDKKEVLSMLKDVLAANEVTENA